MPFDDVVDVGLIPFIFSNRVGLIKVGGVIAYLTILMPCPYVEELIQDQKPHSIAHIQHFGVFRIVGRSNGIDAERFKYRETALYRALGHCRAQGAHVVVQARPFHFYDLAVEGEPEIGIELDRPDPERCNFVVQSGCSRLHRCLHLIHIW